MPTQNVSLTPELEKFVKAQVSSGYFSSISEVHRAALSGMARREEERNLHVKRLTLDIESGLKDLETGAFEAFDTFEELEKSLNRILDDVLSESEDQSA